MYQLITRFVVSSRTTYVSKFTFIFHFHNTNSSFSENLLVTATTRGAWRLTRGASFCIQNRRRYSSPQIIIESHSHACQSSAVVYTPNKEVARMRGSVYRDCLARLSVTYDTLTRTHVNTYT